MNPGSGHAFTAEQAAAQAGFGQGVLGRAAGVVMDFLALNFRAGDDILSHTA
jgi:hypothetical protein